MQTSIAVGVASERGGRNNQDLFKGDQSKDVCDATWAIMLSCLAYRPAMKRILALLICLDIAACTVAEPPVPAGNTHAVSVPGRLPQADSGDCIPELYAYTSVVSLAEKLGSDRDVFDDALIDLREQLVDCLTDQKGDVLPIHHPAGRLGARLRDPSSASSVSPYGPLNSPASVVRPTRSASPMSTPPAALPSAVFP